MRNQTHSWRVIVPDSIENTGLDSARFPSRAQALEAQRTLLSARSGEPSIRTSVERCEREAPTTTVGEWESVGW